MIVVSDASPLNILIRIGCVEVLPSLFGSVVIPPAVAAELSHPATPQPIRQWLSSPPAWLRIQAPAKVDLTLEFDDAGEREAISLALELHADLLLADDRKARRAAQIRGLVVTGAVGVLESASARSMIDLQAAFAKLRATDFIVAQAIIDAALARDASRKK
jgi:predicted nucleic acid-binding protein